MYTLGEKPRTPSEAYDTLETVFGASEFDAEEAAGALVEVMDMSATDAQRTLQSLLSAGAIEEV